MPRDQSPKATTKTPANDQASNNGASARSQSKVDKATAYLLKELTEKLGWQPGQLRGHLKNRFGVDYIRESCGNRNWGLAEANRSPDKGSWKRRMKTAGGKDTMHLIPPPAGLPYYSKLTRPKDACKGIPAITNKSNQANIYGACEVQKDGRGCSPKNPGHPTRRMTRDSISP